jgi:hypothetical protein
MAHARDEHARDEHARDEHARDEHARDEHARDDHARDDHARDECVCWAPMLKIVLSVATLLELAKAAGYSTGIVVTSRLTHATPACFTAHASNRW